MTGQTKTNILLSIIAVLFVAVLFLLYLNLTKVSVAPVVQIPTPTPYATVAPTETIAPVVSNTISPTTAPVVNRIKILDTTAWVDYSCGQISYKLPSNYTSRCESSTTGSFNVYFAVKDGYSSYISINNYDGGSRRQYWIQNMQPSAEALTKYVRFQESMFGTVAGLDVFASGGWWQGGYASPILIANGKTIVSIYGGRDFNDQTNKIIRWDITDTIASTIRFLK